MNEPLTKNTTADTRMSSFPWSLIPRYDELTLYLYSLSFWILLFLDDTFRSYLLHQTWAIGVIFIGAVLSIYHVFTSRRKKKGEIFYLWLFVIYLNCIMAIHGLKQFHILAGHVFGLNMIPLVYNLLYSLLMYVLIYKEAYANNDVPDISNGNASSKHVLIVTIPVALAFIICQFMNAAWNTTYSWSVFVGIIGKDIALQFYPLLPAPPCKQHGKAKRGLIQEKK